MPSLTTRRCSARDTASIVAWGRGDPIRFFFLVNRCAAKWPPQSATTTTPYSLATWSSASMINGIRASNWGESSLSLSLSCAYYLSHYVDEYRWMAISLSRRFDWYVNYSCFYSWLVFNYRIDRERIRYTGVLIGRNFDQRERESYTRELDELIQDRARLFSASFVPLCAAGFSHYVFYLTRVHTHVCTLGVLGKMFFDVD